MSEKRLLKIRKCDKCGRTAECSAAEIKHHAAVCKGVQK